MECISPISIRDPKGASAAQRITVPCGRCVFCLSNRRAEWSVRLEEEQRKAVSAYFLTLTYTDEKLTLNDDGQPVLVKKDVQDFHKRLRFEISKYFENMAPEHFKAPRLNDRQKDARLHGLMTGIQPSVSEWPKIKYYTVGEYGPNTERPHYHGIYFNVPAPVMERVDSIWNNGHIKVVPSNMATIGYTTKYLIQEDEKDYTKKQKPFALMSKGLGANYLERAYKWHKSGQRFYVETTGVKKRLPRYYKDKIFDEHEKQKNNENTTRIREHNYNREKERLEKMGVDIDSATERNLEYRRKLMLKQSNKNRSL